MYKVIQRLKRSFAVFSALFLTLITTKVRAHELCGFDELMECAKPLSVITDSGPSFVSSKADLDKICPDLKDAIRCIHAYTRNCMNNNHRKHFKKLFHGTGSMVHELCKNGTYQEEYLKHVPCMKKVEPEMNLCFKKYTKFVNEIQSKTPNINSSEPDLVTYQKRKREAADEGIKGICCSFQEYIECSTHTMERTCGQEASDFTRKFLDKMSFQMIQLHCTNYGARECGLMSSSGKIETSGLLALLTTLVLYMLT